MELLQFVRIFRFSSKIIKFTWIIFDIKKFLKWLLRSKPLGLRTAFISGGKRLLKLIILFGIICRVITSFPKILTLHLHIRRKNCLVRHQTSRPVINYARRSHVICTNTVLIHLCRERRSARSTNTRC